MTELTDDEKLRAYIDREVERRRKAEEQPKVLARLYDKVNRAIDEGLMDGECFQPIQYDQVMKNVISDRLKTVKGNPSNPFCLSLSFHPHNGRIAIYQNASSYEINLSNVEDLLIRTLVFLDKLIEARAKPNGQNNYIARN